MCMLLVCLISIDPTCNPFKLVIHCLLIKLLLHTCIPTPITGIVWSRLLYHMPKPFYESRGSKVGSLSSSNMKLATGKESVTDNGATSRTFSIEKGATTRSGISAEKAPL